MKKSLIFYFMWAFVFLVPVCVSFEDIDDNDHEIKFLAKSGVVQGKSANQYMPERHVNRAEMLKILFETTSVDIGINMNNCFLDVQAQWYAPYVCLAKEAGIINGYPDGNFRPENPVNLAEALKITFNFFGQSLDDFTGSWYVPYINRSEQLSIHNPIFSLSDHIDRREMAKIVVRALVTDLTGQKFAMKNLLTIQNWGFQVQHFTNLRGFFDIAVKHYKESFREFKINLGVMDIPYEQRIFELGSAVNNAAVRLSINGFHQIYHLSKDQKTVKVININSLIMPGDNTFEMVIFPLSMKDYDPDLISSEAYLVVKDRQNEVNSEIGIGYGEYPYESQADLPIKIIYNFIINDISPTSSWTVMEKMEFNNKLKTEAVKLIKDLAKTIEQKDTNQVMNFLTFAISDIAKAEYIDQAEFLEVMTKAIDLLLKEGTMKNIDYAHLNYDLIANNQVLAVTMNGDSIITFKHPDPQLNDYRLEVYLALIDGQLILVRF